MSEPLAVDAMPTFTVLTPHYNEKKSFARRIAIHESLYTIEWENFVKDTKFLAEYPATSNDAKPSTPAETSPSKFNALPFYIIGLNCASPQVTLQTHIWASLRTWTLNRTVYSMMNYAKAIKLLYHVENPEVVQLFDGNMDKLERELDKVVRRKFKFVVAMQCYSNFNKEEQENAKFLLRVYPDLQIAYLGEEPPHREGGESRIFSVLIDRHSDIIPGTKRRKPKFKFELPGNPILGDGKSDNQNHALIEEA